MNEDRVAEALDRVTDELRIQRETMERQRIEAEAHMRAWRDRPDRPAAAPRRRASDAAQLVCWLLAMVFWITMLVRLFQEDDVAEKAASTPRRPRGGSVS